MNPTNSDETRTLTIKVDDLFFGFKIIAFLFLLVATTGNIMAALSIHQFQQIYQDALPGKPLPGLTLLVIYWQSLIFYLSLLWPILGASALLIRNRFRVAIVILSVALTLTLLQSGVVAMALRLPMIGIVYGMSDEGGK